MIKFLAGQKQFRQFHHDMPLACFTTKFFLAGAWVSTLVIRFLAGQKQFRQFHHNICPCWFSGFSQDKNNLGNGTQKSIGMMLRILHSDNAHMAKKMICYFKQSRSSTHRY
jgi:hypothetical protein